MSVADMLMSAAQVVGGMGLFIFGMHVMTAGLREAAGTALRTVLTRTRTACRSWISSKSFPRTIIFW